MNRLKSATSPYLLQHAANPVDWWPWSDEAFAEARRRDVPVLLSVGYAACHWCHVMAHESFEDEATAAIVNGSVVAIKVDREERPDIDAVYMSATQAMTGQGGWPMTVFMTPDGDPFLCGTYYPRGPFRAARDRGRGRLEEEQGPDTERVAADQGVSGRERRCHDRARQPGGRAQPGRRDRHRRRRPGGELRPGARRIRRRAEVPAVDGPGVPAPLRRANRAVARPGDGRGHLRGDGPRRHVRPAGRRLRQVQRGRELDRAALREDALRQRAARRRLHPPVAADRTAPRARRGGARPPGGGRDLRLHAQGAAHARGRPGRLARRRQRRQRGRVTTSGPRPSCARSSARTTATSRHARSASRKPGRSSMARRFCSA